MKLKIVYGAPCSGKSTFVRNNIGENDIVYDYDEITRAITYGAQHLSKRDLTHQYVLDFRLAMIRRFRSEQQIENAWVISSFLTDSFKSFIADLDPEYIQMETSQEECLSRLETDEMRPDKEDWREKINEWFLTYGGDKPVNKGLREKLTENRQFRTIGSVDMPKKENRFGSEYYVEGYATTFQPYVLYEDENGPVYELFTKECFIGTDMGDIIFQYNHEGKVYARQSNGTLAIEIDDHGMKIMADLSKSQSARDLYEEIQNGLTTKMSWGFRLGEYEYNKETRTITHKSVKKIYDVSAVSIPANDGTEISARSLVDGEIQKIMEESQKRDALLLSLEIELEGVK